MTRISEKLSLEDEEEKKENEVFFAELYPPRGSFNRR